VDDVARDIKLREIIAALDGSARRQELRRDSAITDDASRLRVDEAQQQDDARDAAELNARWIQWKEDFHARREALRQDALAAAELAARCTHSPDGGHSDREVVRKRWQLLVPGAAAALLVAAVLLRWLGR
jgi:hypothetical protein